MTNFDFIPLFYFPTTVVYVDDDEKLLKSMKIILEEQTKTKFFNSAEECLNFFSTYKAMLSDYSFLKSVKEDEDYGVLEHTPLDFNIKTIIDISNNQNRHDEISVFILDYNMPNMTGYDLSKELPSFIPKILLTGVAEDKTIIKGFNKNLIDRFIQKGEIDMEEILISYLNELSIQYFQKMSHAILSCLDAEHQIPLSDPIFAKFFHNFCKENNIKEYYLIDKQGSFLCINDKKERLCLAIQTDDSINTWLSTYSIENELSLSQIKEINERKKIPFFGLGVEPWHIDSSNWKQHLYNANPLDGREKLYWAIINL
jgi:FixJ family two-component response regulator